MIVIGRKEEKDELIRCAQSKKPELVCVYGRRRVGKTFLVEQCFSSAFAFRATGLEKGNMRAQLKSFHLRLAQYGGVSKTIPKDWFEAFSQLEQLLRSRNATRSIYGKKIVFLDEFPWFATPRSDFLAAFGEFWNRFGASQADLMLIICGSATSWIISNIVESTGSLYDRVTSQIILHPFSLRETELFFESRGFDWNRQLIAECQMIFGGLPYFLDLLNANESLRWNVDHLCFQDGALLQSETKRLLETTLKSSPVYGQILELLSKHTYGLEKELCLDKLHIPRATFFRSVDDLKKCGYVSEYKSENYGKPLRLQLIDPFLLFHYRFLSDISAQPDVRFSDFQEEDGRYANWRGHAFETLCLYHAEQIRKALGISGVRTRIFPWVSSQQAGGAQIDLVIERADKLTNLCEIKFTDHPFSMHAQDDEGLYRKAKVFREETKTTNALKWVLITANGIRGTAYTERISKILTLDDLF